MRPMETPDTRYARTSDGAYIAFQTFGSGPIDVLLVPGYLTNLDENWAIPAMVDFHERLGSFARVIVMDRRGVGLSDRLARGTSEPLETHVDDILAVLDAVNATSVCVLATETAAMLATLFAGSHPDRIRSLVLFMPLPCPIYILGGRDQPDEDWPYEVDDWGVGYARHDLEMFLPSVAGDPEMIRAWARYVRSAASPSSALALFEQYREVDVREAFAAIQAPTLLLLRTDTTFADRFRTAVDAALDRIPDVRLVELPGRDVPYWVGDRTAPLAEIEAFFTGNRTATVAAPSRGLATVLFTDIVGSTERAVELGDERWRALLRSHHAVVRTALDRHGGTEIDTAGDGFLATFDGPARAVRAALDVTQNVTDLGIQVRAGAHTGEVERENGGIVGVAVHIGARIAAEAGPSEVLVSQTVKDLVGGSGLEFSDVGEHALKGVPGPWRLFRVVA
jgi:class 3 adenylate cyclase/pimeloyl-ACP methyl ester carboxylesterase